MQTQAFIYLSKGCVCISVLLCRHVLLDLNLHQVVCIWSLMSGGLSWKKNESSAQKCFMLQASATVVPSRTGTTRDKMKSNTHDEWLKKRAPTTKIHKIQERNNCSEESKRLQRKASVSEPEGSSQFAYLIAARSSRPGNRSVPPSWRMLQYSLRRLERGYTRPAFFQSLLGCSWLDWSDTFAAVWYQNGQTRNWTILSVSLPNVRFCFSDSPSGEHYQICVNCRSDEQKNHRLDSLIH